MQEEDSKEEDSTDLDILFMLLSLRTWLESYKEYRVEGNLATMTDLLNHLIREFDDGTE